MIQNVNDSERSFYVFFEGCKVYSKGMFKFFQRDTSGSYGLWVNPGLYLFMLEYILGLIRYIKLSLQT